MKLNNFFSKLFKPKKSKPTASKSSSFQYANFDSPQNQYFSFPSTLIHYISKNPISADGVLKLQKTCKYFFAKNKIAVVNHRVGHFKEFLCFFRSSKEKLCFKDFPNIKFWITNEFQYSSFNPLKIPENIYRCSLKYLYIHDQNLQLSEMDFLLNGKTILNLTLDYVNIYDNNGDIVSCDQILAKVPNLLKLCYKCKKQIFSDEVLLKMNALEFNSKFTFFHISITNEANVKLLCEFIIKNSDGSSKFLLDVIKMNTENYKITLKTAVENMLQNWKTLAKPEIYV